MRIEFDIEATPEELKALLPSVEIEGEIELAEPAPSQPPRTMEELRQRLRALAAKARATAQPNASESAKDGSGFTLRAGYCYRTRSGKVVYVAAIGSPYSSTRDTTQAIGWEQESGRPNCWGRDGRCSLTRETPEDIVECRGPLRIEDAPAYFPEPPCHASNGCANGQAESFLKPWHFYRCRDGKTAYVLGRNPYGKGITGFVTAIEGDEVPHTHRGDGMFNGMEDDDRDLVECLGTSKPQSVKAGE